MGLPTGVEVKTEPTVKMEEAALPITMEETNTVLMQTETSAAATGTVIADQTETEVSVNK